MRRKELTGAPGTAAGDHMLARARERARRDPGEPGQRPYAGVRVLAALYCERNGAHRGAWGARPAIKIVKIIN